MDTSAVLALIQGERGADVVEGYLSNARMLTVNVCETVSKLMDRGFDAEAARAAVTKLPLIIVDFDLDLALLAASFRPATRSLGFSLADRACLALAKHGETRALTADRAWKDVDLGIEIELIR
nr:type II toxin-antitoxin system VapC family toxin [Jiella sonneratiae]